MVEDDKEMNRDFFKSLQNQTDSLTGLYARDVIISYTKHLIETGTPFSFALIDIDNFKHVNDNYGHSAGDKIISFFATNLKNAFGERAVLGRFGGDEFMVVIEGITDYDAVWSLCREVLRSIDGKTSPEFPNLYITCTLGLSRFPKDAQTYEELFETTDKALYRGKIKGRNCFIIYLEEKHKNIKLHGSNDTTISSMQLHTEIFKMINESPNLAEGIKNVFSFLSSTLMIDHISIQTDKKLIFSQVYTLSRTKEFEFIGDPFFVKEISPVLGCYYLNDVTHLKDIGQSALLEICEKQGIKSTVYASIAFNDKVFGYIRADSSSKIRIWQYSDMDLLITAANAIAMSLHYQNKKVEEL